MAQQGILTWATSIRATMVNDPCRQSLEDQIQTHGFLFLDDYLDNILAQARRDPLIDLVKTPGRKRDAPKRTRAAVAANNAKSAIVLSLEDDDAGKENQAPVNSFHKALLQAKDGPVDGSHHSSGELPEIASTKAVVSNQSKSVPIIEEVEVEIEEEQTVEEILSSSPPASPAARLTGDKPLGLLVPPPLDQVNDLSVIAEDDEIAERSVQLPQSNPIFASLDNLVAQETPIQTEIRTEHMEVDHDDTHISSTTTSSSGQTFHSISLNSPRARQSSTRPSSDVDGYLTAPLPQVPHSLSGPIYLGKEEATTALSPATAPSVSAPDISNAPFKDPPTQFPSLPVPSPMRKSMRIHREPSVGTGMSVPALPTNAVGAGKRTSWLMKAREVKAMEAPGKHVSTFGSEVPVPGMSRGTKRKSGEMLTSSAVPSMAGVTALEEEERKRKVVKMGETGDTLAKDKPKEPDPGQRQPSPLPASESFLSPEDKTTSMPMEEMQEDMIDRLKRTVEGFGARAGKSIGQSLGGPAAAAALAEAKAAKVAAEARIAERDGKSAVPSAQKSTVSVEQTRLTAAPPKTHERNLSVSDLIIAYEDNGKGKPKGKPTDVEKGFKPVRTSPSTKMPVGDESTSTTPPNSPPSTRNSSFVLPSGPVFNKPPVFVPPPAPKSLSFNVPSNVFALPAASSLGIPVRMPSPSSQRGAPALSAQSTSASVLSDVIFDRENDVPAWMPNTQETDYSSVPETQPSQKLEGLDEDDSWPMVDEKLAAANPSWTPFGFTKEDSMTWSTLPTESQRGDTRSTHNGTSHTGELRREHSEQNVPVNLEMDTYGFDKYDDGVDLKESDLEDLDLEAGKSTVSLVKPNDLERSQSQMSMASTSSSQSQVGWVGQATKLVSSVLGGSKSKKPQVPSLQRAAAAAKKEQEEKDKKAARRKEIENMRQLEAQKKAEDEKTRALEDEKKAREEREKRKREREENTDKRPLKTGTKKADEDTTKKRKITVEIEKKPIEYKKPPSKDKKDTAAPSRMAQPMTTSTTVKSSGNLNKSGASLKPSGSNTILTSSATYNAQVASGSTSIVKASDSKTVKTSNASTSSSIKGKGKVKIQEESLAPPSLQVKDQMAARAKAQIQAAKQQLPQSTEDIELPDINSEYSDSDDEDRPRTFDPPDWAQSPELRQQLHIQSTFNPDDIFGPIRPLRMEEVFRTRQSRFRARTSSANWTGTDRLTAAEELAYARRMGYH